MSKKLLSVSVRGKHKSWTFEFYGDPIYLPEWESDGLEIFEVSNTIPAWVAELGLLRPWCFVQDVWNFKNPWSKS